MHETNIKFLPETEDYFETKAFLMLEPFINCLKTTKSGVVFSFLSVRRIGTDT